MESSSLVKDDKIKRSSFLSKKMRNNLNNLVRIDIMGFDIPKHRKAAKKLLPRKRKKKTSILVCFNFKSLKKIGLYKKIKK